MTKVILEFEGEQADFERAMFERDGDFDLWDNILWELDYGEAKGFSKHLSKHGDIIIKVERTN